MSGNRVRFILVEEKNETKVFKKTSKKTFEKRKESYFAPLIKHLTSVNRS
jgi:hypothetical protein